LPRTDAAQQTLMPKGSLFAKEVCSVGVGSGCWRGVRLSYFDKFNVVKNSELMGCDMAFLKRTLGKWYRAAQKGVCPAAERRKDDYESAALELFVPTPLS
jgi:hypothetical protein